MTCEYDELSENNLLNQILKTTVMLLLRSTRVAREYKSDLKKEMLFLSNVDTIGHGTIRWSAILFQRNNNAHQSVPVDSRRNAVDHGLKRIPAGFFHRRAADEPTV